MPLPNITTADVWEDSQVTLMAAWRDNTGASPINETSTVITYGVWDMEKNTEVVAEGTVITVVIADHSVAEQAPEGRWTKTTGGTDPNFLFELPAAALSNGPRRYRVEVKIVIQSQDPVFLVWELDANRIMSS